MNEFLQSTQVHARLNRRGEIEYFPPDSAQLRDPKDEFF
jgi:hypothetical protein